MERRPLARALAKRDSLKNEVKSPGKMERMSIFIKVIC
jgi:hypothetical protein